MNRKKGFTLVELLAVIAILAIILTILAPSLLNGVKGKKEDALNKIYDLIELAARNYVMDYDIDTPTIIQMEDLCKTNYIECPILNPETEEELNGYVFAGNDFFYGEDESIELIADFNVAEPNQTFNETYAPGTVIDLQDVSKESYEFLGWEVAEGNSFIKDNKLIIGTTSTLIKPKLVRYLNNYIKYLYNDESSRNTNGIIEDDTADKNIRYAGSDPNNYVYFNCKDKDDNNVKYGEENYNYKNSCEVWRIIGVFNTKTSVSDTVGAKRIKLVRDAFSTNMSWDSSSKGSGTENNRGYGINEWSQADLKNMLNGYYIGVEGATCTYCSSINQGTCTKDCSGSVTPLSSTSIDMIDSVLWNTGATEYSATLPLSTMYEGERGTQNGKICTSGNDCNDSVERTTTWEGLVGLIYPSDYAYASTDAGCANDIVGSDSTCNTNNWLHPSSGYYWTISPRASSSSANFVWCVNSSSRVNRNDAYYALGVRPALYLDSNIQITGGDGTSNLPYVLDLNSGQ